MLIDNHQSSCDVNSSMTLSDPRITLVLDLDETLVMSYLDPNMPHDFEISFSETDRISKVYVSLRPWVQYFLEIVSKYYRVVVFTASEKEYASRIIDYLDPYGNLISERYYRDSCRFIGGVYVKDLNWLGFDLSKTIIVDNSLHVFAFHVFFVV